MPFKAREYIICNTLINICLKVFSNSWPCFIDRFEDPLRLKLPQRRKSIPLLLRSAARQRTVS